jgi:anti-anti-sigma regulatory factor
MKISFEELTIYEIDSFHKKVLKEIQNSKSSFTLNFASVKKIDLNVIQLLLSIKKYCDEKNINLKLTNIEAKQVKQTFKIFNVENTLGITI